MLYIYFGNIEDATAPEEYVMTIDGWFNALFDSLWTDDGWAARVIKEIDKSELLGSKRGVDSPILGRIDIINISGGAKSLIMMNAMPNLVYNGNCMGNNCWPLLLELTKTKDIAISLRYFPHFKWVEGAQVQCINSGEMFNSFKEFTDAHFHYIGVGPEITDFDKVDWKIEVKKLMLDDEDEDE
jgi:hypothetical protein